MLSLSVDDMSDLSDSNTLVKLNDAIHHLKKNVGLLEEMAQLRAKIYQLYNLVKPLVPENELIEKFGHANRDINSGLSLVTDFIMGKGSDRDWLVRAYPKFANYGNMDLIAKVLEFKLHQARCLAHDLECALLQLSQSSTNSNHKLSRL
jgi:hypothetical protein